MNLMTQPDETRAVVVDTGAPGGLVLRKVPLAAPRPEEATVRVTAISLNRGEVKRALTAMGTGDRPGWDFAGVVEQPAEQGNGPSVGTRVVGLLPAGAWAERVRAPLHAIASLPDGVTDAQAATLPVAGLTALHALRKGGLLLGRKVLIDGASGGVGHLAVQLAAASGALVHAHVRRADQAAAVTAWGGSVVVGERLEAARPSGPFHLIIDSVGGSALGAALGMLERGGTCVTLGVSEGSAVTFESGAFFRTTGVSLYGLMLFDELARSEDAAHGLALLAGLVARGSLRPAVEVEAPWTDIAAVAGRLMDRAFGGKAVLHIASPAGRDPVA
jgi:NADPH2:quinone reductase